MMDLVQRAHIFSAFDSLKGYRELLREAEKEPVKPRVLAEDDIEELNRIINGLEKGMMITVEYWKDKEIRKKTGVVSRINIPMNELQIVKRKIRLDQIIWVEIDEEML